MDHFTYVLASDGDLMEGLSAEAAALAGHLGLGKLIVLYDDNGICLSGSTALTFTEDIDGRFTAAGWQVIAVPDGNDVAAVDRAIAEAKAETARPSLIRLRTTIGCGAPGKQNTSAAHGAPLGPEEVRAAKENLGWPLEPPFFVPDEVLEMYRGATVSGAGREAAWEETFAAYAADYPEEAAEFGRVMKGELPAGWKAALPVYGSGTKDVATRKISEAVLQALAPAIPELMGGSADLNPSTFTWLKGQGDFQKPGEPPACREGAVGGEWGYGGRNIHFGVREHAMAAIAGGMALHGGLIPFTGTFFTFCRLHAARDPPGRPDGAPGDLRLHPRQHRRRRGRPHPPARRAAHEPAGGPQPDGDPAGRRQRNGGGLARRPGKQHPAPRPSS